MGLPEYSTLFLRLIPQPPTLFSYIVARDYGFAPNPFFGFCTLATCKPRIRERARIGDWIFGTGSKTKGRTGNLVYAMRVTEAMSFEEYWDDPRFRRKRPDMCSSKKMAFGDNIYFRESETGKWCQLDSHHSYVDGTRNDHNVVNDTQVNRVLVSDEFVYLGGSGPVVPEFRGESVCHRTQGHRCRFAFDVSDQAIAWIRGLNESGYSATPLEWM